MTGVRAVDSAQDNLDLAISYLRNACNDTLHLCREAPRVAPNVYWIASDNLLAFKALEPYDPQLSSTISSELVRLAKVYHLPTSSEYGVPLSLRYDVVMRDNETLELPPKDVTHLTLYNGSYVLRYDIANGTNRFYNWTGFADLLLLVALSNRNSGDLANAIGNFTVAANMWDGVGLQDLGFTTDYGEGQAPGNPHAYATYKLGLLLYVSGKLGVHLPFENDVVKRIWSMQNQSNGGIFTHMMPDGSSGTSDTNTETTAMVILGMTSVSIPEFDFPVLVFCVSVLTCLLIVRRIRHR